VPSSGGDDDVVGQVQSGEEAKETVENETAPTFKNISFAPSLNAEHHVAALFLHLAGEALQPFRVLLQIAVNEELLDKERGMTKTLNSRRQKLLVLVKGNLAGRTGD